jgi:activator of HSP90 ATPase
MSIEFSISAVIPAAPEKLYRAWLSSEEHAAMTGSPAQLSGEAGDTFKAWGGYITGKNLELEPGKRILQAWRTTEFDESDEDSLLEVLLERSGEHTRITIRHSNLPDHGMQYQQGWIDSYFDPMKAYFGRD